MRTRNDNRGGPPLLVSRDLLSAPGLAPVNPSKPEDALARFGVDETLVQRIIGVALQRGGDFCDLYFQHSISSHIRLEDTVVSMAHTNVDLGVGIRVVKGDQTGYSFTENLSPGVMLDTARTASAIANGPTKWSPHELRLQQFPSYYAIQTPWESADADRKIRILQEVNDIASAADKRIIKTRVSFWEDTSQILIADSDGRLTYDSRPMIDLDVDCTAEQNGRREENGAELCAREGIEFLTEDRVASLTAEAVRRTVALFDAVKLQGGEMEVVLAAGHSGILLHEAIGHGMEADFTRKGISIFSDKLGKPVAREFVSIVDDGTNPNLRGSINVDDEGTPTQKTWLVENGILAGYMHDRTTAVQCKAKLTGNGRRQSFRFEPMPRMRNTYMLPGRHKREEIIASVRKGLLAETFANGQVFIGAGDFTFYVKSGYLIENGNITRPVKDINIVGNGPDVLRKIVMVADDLKMSEAGWICGKIGQGVPVSMGLPTVKVSSIIVGGVGP